MIATTTLDWVSLGVSLIVAGVVWVALVLGGGRG